MAVIRVGELYMRNEVWVTLARYLPPEVQGQLSLVTTGGTEIAMQSILRVERDFMVIKGRLSGSQDTGRIFFIPYVQIDYLGTMQAMKDAEFEEMFGGLVFTDQPAFAETIPPSPSGADLPVPVATADGGAPASSLSLPRPQGSGPRPAIKSAVLERFRARNGTTQEPATPRPGESS